VIDIAARTCEKVVETNDIRAALKEPLAKVGPEETGAAGHEHAGFEMHTEQLPKLRGALWSLCRQAFRTRDEFWPRVVSRQRSSPTRAALWIRVGIGREW
jgi:hypothetical protein